jgi:transposase-like protein
MEKPPSELISEKARYLAKVYGLRHIAGILEISHASVKRKIDTSYWLIDEAGKINSLYEKHKNAMA